MCRILCGETGLGVVGAQRGDTEDGIEESR